MRHLDPNQLPEPASHPFYFVDRRSIIDVGTDEDRVFPVIKCNHHVLEHRYNHVMLQPRRNHDCQGLLVAFVQLSGGQRFMVTPHRERPMELPAPVPDINEQIVQAENEHYEGYRRRKECQCALIADEEL